MALYEWLAGRASPIEDDLEAALWGLVIEVDSGETTLDQARSWVAEQLDLDAAAA